LNSKNIDSKVQSVEINRDDIIRDCESDSDHSDSSISLWSYNSSFKDDDQSSSISPSQSSAVNIKATFNEKNEEVEFIMEQKKHNTNIAKHHKSSISSSHSASAEWSSPQISNNSYKSFSCLSVNCKSDEDEGENIC
jgi:hypothetical protein